jgi:hypothetical protein
VLPAQVRSRRAWVVRHSAPSADVRTLRSCRCAPRYLLRADGFPEVVPTEL